MIISIYLIVSIQNKYTNVTSYIEQQMTIFKTPIPFIHKIQYFYDRAIIFYINKKPTKAIENLEISKSFIASYNIDKLKEADIIINKTINNIKSHKAFNYSIYQKNLYLSLTAIVHNYYKQSHNMIKSLNHFIQAINKTNVILEITIFLFAILIVLVYILYSIKEQIKTISLKDPLTNSFNRRYFFEEIKKLPKCVHSLIMVDLDHFKIINDTYGHEMGDYVLKETINIINNNIRKNDIIIRWGGEEFIILLKNVDRYKALEIAEILRKKIASFNFNGIKITASLGIKEIKDKITNEDLKTLDNALYLSKRKGRNKVSILD